MHSLNGAGHLVFMRSWGKAVHAHNLKLCIGMDLMTVAFGASILEGGRLTFVLFDPLAAAVIGRSLERRVGVGMDDAQRGSASFPFWTTRFARLVGLANYRIKYGRPFVRQYFMYITLGGNLSFRRGLRTSHSITACPNAESIQAET